MGRFARTWKLMGASWRVLKADKELIAFPVMSSLATLLVMATFALPLFDRQTLQYLDQAQDNDPIIYAVLFLFYLVTYFIIIFFNSAIVACVLKRLDGGDPTVGYGLSAAWQRLPQILGWALLSSTVGFVLRLIEERVQLVGRIIIGLLGMAWTVTSFLVVPVLVAEGQGPVDSYKRSVDLLKRSWGEQIIGNVGFGLIFFLLGVLPMAVLIGLSFLGNGIAVATALVIAVVYLILLGLIQATLQTIYQVAVYRYAADGKAPAGFDDDLIAGSFKPKR